MNNNKGKLLTVEGPDGAGKSSSVPFIREALEELGYRVVVTREPGGCELSERLRDMVLFNQMALKTELLLFAAARAEHLQRTIYPAIERGEIVLCDRFADSTYAYQGYGRGARHEVMQMEKFVLGDFQPHHTLFFDITLDESERRLQQRSGRADRFDSAEQEFKRLVWEGYQDRFRHFSNRMFRVDAMQDLPGVRAQLLTWVQQTFPAIN